jgi:hypothetical protein
MNESQIVGKMGKGFEFECKEKTCFDAVNDFPISQFTSIPIKNIIIP